MATINAKMLNDVKNLYYDKSLSVQEIANKLNVSIGAVFYFMRKNDLVRRKVHESNSIGYAKRKLSFKLRELKTEKMRMLKVAGVMLYWGEGCKSDKMGVVDFANSDKDMIILFLKFLRIVCGIDEKRLRVFPYLHANQNVEKSVEYWSGITGISKNQFTKPYIRKDYDENKQNKMPFGLIHIRYSDKKLLNLIKSWIKEYSK